MKRAWRLRPRVDLRLEVSFYERTDFCFGLSQRYYVGPRIQLALGVTADDLVLPERQTFGIPLIHCYNSDVGALLRNLSVS
jgi:hypothetical protein